MQPGAGECTATLLDRCSSSQRFSSPFQHSESCRCIPICSFSSSSVRTASRYVPRFLSAGTGKADLGLAAVFQGYLLRCLLSDTLKIAQDPRDHGLTVKETAFEFLPLHAVVDVMPMAPETEVMLPSGGLNTEISTVPGCAMSAAVIAANS